MRIKPFHIIVVLLTAATVAAYVAGIYLDRQVDGKPPSNVPMSAYIKNVNSRDGSGRTPLMLAAKRGDVESVRDLIVRGADVNTKNNKGHSSLNYAAEKGHTGVVRLLLDNGADINARSNKGSTALMLAVEGNHVDTTKLLIERGADIRLKRWGCNLLEMAAGMGRPEIIRLLAEHGADVNEVTDENGMTPLMWAARDGRLESVKTLVSLGADVTMERDGWSALDFARRFDRDDVIGYFSKEVELSQTDMNTAMILACRKGDSALALNLIDRGADINTSIRYTPLMFAVRSGDIGFTTALLDRGADMNIRYFGDYSALDFAIANGDVDIAMLLLNRGAEVNKELDGESDISETTLMLAAGMGLEDVVKKMIEMGAEVNGGNDFGWGALRCAVHSGSVETARVLLENGADVTDEWGKAAWDTAIEEDRPDMILLLLEYSGGHSIAEYALKACDSGRYEILEKMFSRGLDANIRDEAGKTLLDVAEGNGDSRMKEFLLSHGATATRQAENFH